MLKRLELVGFKSFADKTVFEFGDGITAIVGPNGSGKSNIVDAVRWILGEQSAKSLRGGEMADVIFNGSSSRRSLGLAEVTMTFDNRKRQLATEAEEVQITRRVYRTGEGEYLINGQASRLRDIKEMFLGSGAGNDDLCIIAQGKVDVLLQASNKDRRTIFEEAAGISRFKAKKTETLRTLERVDQNLSRVKDIIEEIEKQLRSVKLQASKAQRYQEHSDRLKELRLTLGLTEYRELTQKLDAETQALDDLKAELDQRAARAGACEAEAERLEIALADLDDQLHEEEAALAKRLQQIQSEETTIAHESTLTGDLEAELAQTRKRLADLTVRVRTLADTTSAAEGALQEAATQAEHDRLEVEVHEAELQATIARLTALHEQVAADKGRHFEEMRRAAHLQNEAVASKAQVDNLRRERDRLRQRSDTAATSLASLDVELQELLQAEAQLVDRLQHARQVLQEQKLEQERLRTLRDRTHERLAEMRQERSALAGRIEVLAGLIKSHEGLGTGVREVIALIEQPDAGPWSSVIGMIADFLTVKLEYAPLIDLALGEWAQRFVVRDVQLFEQALAEHGQTFSGRVSFLPLTSIPKDADPAVQELKQNRLVQLSLMSRLKEPDGPTPEHAGLVAPADQLVSCEHPELADLPAQLLGRTLIVRDLATARVIAEHAPGFRLITLQGDLLEPDGTLTIGAHHAETGVLSRKSEWRELTEQLAALEVRILEIEGEEQNLRDKLQGSEAASQEQQEIVTVLAEQCADLRGRVQRHQDRRQGLHEEVTVSRDEIQRIEQEVQTLEQAWRQNEAQAAEAEALVQTLHGRLHEADEEIHVREDQRQLVQQACTQAQVTFAQVEERLRGLQTQYSQASRDYQQRNQELLQNQESVGNLKARLLESQRTMLHASSLLAHDYLAKEHAQRQVAAMLEQRERKRSERARLTQQAQTARTEWRTHQESVHQRELEAANLHHQRDTLVQRLRDDYQIELADLSVGQDSNPVQPTTELESCPTPFDPAATQQEIDELRRKLGRLGNVNLAALEELQDLERRATELRTQFDDLTSAKKSAEEIIAKINVDSKRLFMETFAVVRTHFQELFRKLFGGGMADVVLEDENDVLESGIDIIARPPGKELRSITLMSGGEKTLTAVALLLAVFRSKPSPFCLLDEVDAALDEANIARFTAVLREFLELSQFIIVTHSKKTMACADTLYGITMQESGISKQVTIRFEDWVEEKAQAS
ncbi:MAG: chromosome segregation protein SMC [Gemmataceae bacterium]|nr:chromosome segregation protein SMC [Gemmataceae bacterium]